MIIPAQENEGSSTRDQHRAIVAAGLRHVFDLEALRGMTPRGSLRALSFVQACSLLDRLNGERPVAEDSRPRPRKRRSKPGVIGLVTSRQREHIAKLQRALGWTDARLDSFLEHTFSLRMAGLARRTDASRIIAILEKLLIHAQR